MFENSLKIGYQTLNKIILGWTGCQNKKGFMNQDEFTRLLLKCKH